MKKGIICLLLLAALSLGICPPAAAAEKTAMISVGSAAGTSGDIVRVPVAIQDNPGIAGFSFIISFDESAASLEKIEAGDILESGSFTPNTTKRTVTWFHAKNITCDGVILYLSFKLKSRDHYGSFSVTVSLKDGKAKSLSNEKSQAVPAEMKNGTLRCRSGKEIIASGARQNEKWILKIDDAPKTPVRVIVAGYQSQRMICITMEVRTLTLGEEELLFESGLKPDAVKVFFLSETDTRPLCKSVNIGGANN